MSHEAVALGVGVVMAALLSVGSLLYGAYIELGNDLPCRPPNNRRRHDLVMTGPNFRGAGQSRTKPASKTDGKI
jgi:hypothetical protein